jgi:aminoacyl-tRNA hydrolase
MNRSGKAVHYWMQKEKIDKNRLLVVMDDLNLDFGKIRLRGKGSDGGHNGLKDIDQVTGGNNYARLRIGIGNEFSKGQQSITCSVSGLQNSRMNCLNSLSGRQKPVSHLVRLGCSMR